MRKSLTFPLALCLNFVVCQEAGHLGNICEIYVYAANLAPGKLIFFFLLFFKELVPFFFFLGLRKQHISGGIKEAWRTKQEQLTYKQFGQD